MDTIFLGTVTVKYQFLLGQVLVGICLIVLVKMEIPTRHCICCRLCDLSWTGRIMDLSAFTLIPPWSLNFLLLIPFPYEFRFDLSFALVRVRILVIRMEFANSCQECDKERNWYEFESRVAKRKRLRYLIYCNGILFCNKKYKELPIYNVNYH